jgi:P27 family predicted phage terminase small subunit
MGKGGHNKKPTQAKIIQGTFRKDRAPAKEPKPEKVSNVPKPPAYLSKYAKKVWKDLAEELVEKGILTVVDLPALEACCEETGKKGKRTLARYMKGRNSQTMPEYTAMNKAWATFKSFLTEFGLTPASRTKLEIAEPKGKGEDPMEKLWNEA